MNTATRVYGKNYVARKAKNVTFSFRQLGIALLMIVALLSAFGVIYAKDLNRRLFIQYQTLQQQAQQDQVQWSKLLLEQGAWSTQSRIQWLAQKRLHMLTPAAKKITFVETDDQ